MLSRFEQMSSVLISVKSKLRIYGITNVRVFFFILLLNAPLEKRALALSSHVRPRGKRQGEQLEEHSMEKEGGRERTLSRSFAPPFSSSFALLCSPHLEQAHNSSSSSSRTNDTSRAHSHCTDERGLRERGGEERGW